MTFNLLSSKDAKNFRRSVENQWGIVISREYSFVKSSSGKIFVLSKGVGFVDSSKLRISSIGLYVADETYGLRLSLDGAILWGDGASKNVIYLLDDQKKLWLSGSNISGIVGDGWVIVKCGDDILGCGLIKNSILKNYVPKSRRIPE
ncbi:hypothetical protein HY483_04260 [Candidatus Woesearchaeota archaeon]|nr:hypothetical protein [Candidatus Woesearchaeota archaeon]